jgi:hypothetical protein
MLVVVVVAFNIPASAQVGIGSIGASTAAISSTAAGIGVGGFGGFGGFGFPFNWGFSQLGVGCFPFNWALGGGLGPFGLGWNQFSPCFGCGSFFSPCFLGSCYQALPFITGNFANIQGTGFGVTPWAFGLGGCARSMPLFFGAHGFGFPFTLGNMAFSLIPAPLCAPVLPACLPATSVCLGVPFITGSFANIQGAGFGVTPWAFGLGGCARSMPLFFGAHGFGFPFTLGNFGLSMPPFIPGGGLSCGVC